MKKETKGVLLVAVGSKGYAYMAANMAWSIKHHDPDVSVHLLCDACYEYIPHDRRMVFDSVSPVDPIDCHTGAILDPGKLKTRLYKYLPFDHNLYLDVDGLCLNSMSITLDALVSDGRYYITSEEGRGKQSEQIKYSVWASNEAIADYFDLKPEQEIVAIQTSWAYMRKCKKAERFFVDVRKAFDRGFPNDRLINLWGGGMPDELIYSGLISKYNLNVAGPENMMFFSERDRNITESEVCARYMFLSLYGNGRGRTMTKLRWWELYDRLMFRWTKEHRDNGDTLATEHIYKHHILKQYKHADNRK